MKTPFQKKYTTKKDKAYFASKSELLTWVSTTLDLEIKSIEETQTGALFCQLLDAAHPGTVRLNKVNWKAKLETEYISNFKLFQEGLVNNNIDKPIDIQRLSKGKTQELIELLQWLYGHHLNLGIEANNYDPLLPETSNGFFHNLEDGLKVFQPELTYFPYTKNGKVYPNDYHVWGRIVKTDVYVKSINNLGVNALGEDRISQFLVWNEDTAATVSLFKYAQSYKFIHRFGIFHYMSMTTASNTRPDIENIYSDIFVLDMMFDFSDNNTKCKKFIVNRALEISTDRKLQIYCEKTALLIKAVLKKMCECEYISEEDKNKLKKSYNITNINLEL